LTRAAFVTGGSGFVGGRLLERLVRDGWAVRALARSDAAAARVREIGAEPVRGDVADAAALARGAAGAEVVFHAAAKVAEWGAWRDFRRVNVDGTKAVLAAARDAGARRLVHVGTEAALLHGEPLVAADERTPLAFGSRAPYSATKAEAEAAVVGARGIETIVVRPRFVWGPGDTTLVPAMIEMIRTGRFRWIGGGRHRTSTAHVDNTVHALVLAADRGTPGAAADAARALALLARVHARRLARPRRSRLRAGRGTGGRAGGAGRVRVGGAAGSANVNCGRVGRLGIVAIS
jgi:nucleoside-diphosphate-sugar epimerase